MSKTEDLAKKLYPDWKTTGVPAVDGLENLEVRIQRVAYAQGYHQAEKDLEITIEDIKKIHTFLYDIKKNKQGVFTFIRLSDEQYQKVLNRFNKRKRK